MTAYKSLGEIAKEYNIPIAEKTNRPVQFEFQALGKEMMNFFGGSFRNRIWPLFHNARYSVPLIRDAFMEFKKQPIAEWRYFMGILNNKVKWNEKSCLRSQHSETAAMLSTKK